MQPSIFNLQLLGIAFSLVMSGLNFERPLFKNTSWLLPNTNLIELPSTLILEPPLQQQALKVLQTKCNVCHKKKNPFKVFSLKNMNKHAPKIYKQVFIYRRMPKGSEVKLTEKEYQVLKDWLQSENIF